jgi:hypothetical protein
LALCLPNSAAARVESQQVSVAYQSEDGEGARNPDAPALLAHGSEVIE